MNRSAGGCGNPYEQARFILAKSKNPEEAGATLEDVVRTYVRH
jgi:hypothetical protein